MAIYSSIASGMITLTGIVFSLTFVMVQFSATAYSPRLVLLLARDPMISHSIGVFSATFLYAIAALAWVDRGGSERVPLLSFLVVILLLLASMAIFVGLVHRVALLQIQRILEFLGDEGRRVIDSIYPATTSSAAPCAETEGPGGAPGRAIAHGGPPLAVQALDLDELVSVARASGGVIEVVAAVGDTVLDSTPLARVSGERTPVDEARLRHAIFLGDERTFEQDPKYALRLLVDIAIRALSPAVNDPTTAVQALDQIGDLLLRLGRRRLEIGEFKDAEGAVRLRVPFPSWDDFLRLALEEIRACGATSVQVMRRLVALIADLKELLPAERGPSLAHWQRRLRASVEKTFADSEERREASTGDRQGLGSPKREGE